MVPHHPCLLPHLYMVSHHMTGTPPLSRTPSHPLSGMPYPHHLAHSTLPPSGHYCSYLAPYSTLPLIQPLPAHHLELLPHVTPTILSNCHLALMHPPITPSWPSGTPCPTATVPSGSLPSASSPTTPAIWPSCPTTPSNCHLALLPSAIPTVPCHLALLAPTPCPIWLPAIAPPAQPSPTPIWTSCSHPTKYHHQRSPPPTKEI